jgi:hypothetical protein
MRQPEACCSAWLLDAVPSEVVRGSTWWPRVRATRRHQVYDLASHPDSNHELDRDLGSIIGNERHRYTKYKCLHSLRCPLHKQLGSLVSSTAPEWDTY